MTKKLILYYLFSLCVICFFGLLLIEGSKQTTDPNSEYYRSLESKKEVPVKYDMSSYHYSDETTRNNEGKIPFLSLDNAFDRIQSFLNEYSSELKVVRGKYNSINMTDVPNNNIRGKVILTDIFPILSPGIGIPINDNRYISYYISDSSSNLYSKIYRKNVYMDSTFIPINDNRYISLYSKSRNPKIKLKNVDTNETKVIKYRSLKKYFEGQKDLMDDGYIKINKTTYKFPIVYEIESKFREEQFKGIISYYGHNSESLNRRHHFDKNGKFVGQVKYYNNGKVSFVSLFDTTGMFAVGIQRNWSDGKSIITDISVDYSWAHMYKLGYDIRDTANWDRYYDKSQIMVFSFDWEGKPLFINDFINNVTFYFRTDGSISHLTDHNSGLNHAYDLDGNEIFYFENEYDFEIVDKSKTKSQIKELMNSLTIPEMQKTKRRIGIKFDNYDYIIQKLGFDMDKE